MTTLTKPDVHHYETQFSFSTKMASVKITETNDHKSEENKAEAADNGPPKMLNMLSETLFKRRSFYEFDD